jgi:hypothetical protein
MDAICCAAQQAKHSSSECFCPHFLVASSHTICIVQQSLGSLGKIWPDKCHKKQDISTFMVCMWLTSWQHASSACWFSTKHVAQASTILGCGSECFIERAVEYQVESLVIVQALLTVACIFDHKHTDAGVLQRKRTYYWQASDTGVACLVVHHDKKTPRCT